MGSVKANGRHLRTGRRVVVALWGLGWPAMAVRGLVKGLGIPWKGGGNSLGQKGGLTIAVRGWDSRQGEKKKKKGK